MALVHIIVNSMMRAVTAHIVNMFSNANLFSNIAWNFKKAGLKKLFLLNNSQDKPKKIPLFSIIILAIRLLAFGKKKKNCLVN